MKTESIYLGKKSRKEWEMIIAAFNGCKNESDLLRWIAKYSTPISGEMTGCNGNLSLSDNPQIIYSDKKVTFWAD